MTKHLYKCVVCGEFTMKPMHHDKKALAPQPAKYSPDDKNGKYRRIAKKQQGLI